MCYCAFGADVHQGQWQSPNEEPWLGAVIRSEIAEIATLIDMADNHSTMASLPGISNILWLNAAGKIHVRGPLDCGTS
jgi:hypothetical protein